MGVFGFDRGGRKVIENKGRGRNKANRSQSTLKAGGMRKVHFLLSLIVSEQGKGGF